jgi:hypothetical protein
MPPQVIWLDDRAARRREAAGGKGATLARLRAGGFPVPPGFVVPTWVFRDVTSRLAVYFARTAFADASWLDAARARLAEAPVPGALEVAVSSALSRLGAGRVAVRSSLVAEDAEAASFAGQLTSVLDVEGAGGVLHAVRTVWASILNPALLDYAARRQGETIGGPDALALAVVVQRMVTPLAAGVAFSVDPVTASRRVVVEAVAGVAADLVSGRAAPDRYVVDERGALAEVQRPPDRPAVLGDDQVLRVARLARDVAERLGGPQDIEWALDASGLQLLQARPITTLGGKRVYSRRMVGDMCPGLIKPLLWSTNSRSMSRRVFGRLFSVEHDFAPLIRRIHSRMYADTTFIGEWLERIGLPANLFETLTRDERARRRPHLTRRLVGHLPRLARVIWRYGRAEPAIEAFLERHPADLDHATTRELARADARALFDAIDRALELHGETQWWVFASAMNMAVRTRLLQRFVAKRAPEVAPGDLLCGLGG